MVILALTVGMLRLKLGVGFRDRYRTYDPILIIN
jgi:hypothetical protein